MRRGGEVYKEIADIFPFLSNLLNNVMYTHCSQKLTELKTKPYKNVNDAYRTFETCFVSHNISTFNTSLGVRFLRL